MQPTRVRSRWLLALALPFGLGACASNSNSAPPASASASAATASDPSANTLTPAEQAQGWRLLFDGTSTKGWRGYKKPAFPEKGWHVESGILKHEKNEEGFHAGDILTDEEFDNFELTLDFKLVPRGNSGIKYLVNEALETKQASSFEFQILDDALHPDATKGKDGNRRLGGLYDLIAPPADKVTHPIGEWNQARVLVDGNHVEHWLNGKMTVTYERNSPELKALIAESKFKDIKGFGEAGKGHILLQDHNDEIAFRNIKIRPIPAKTSQAPGQASK
jgi:hypothetical protein